MLAEIVLPALRRVPSTGILIVIANMIMVQCIGVRARHAVVPYGTEGSIERDEIPSIMLERGTSLAEQPFNSESMVSESGRENSVCSDNIINKLETTKCCIQCS